MRVVVTGSNGFIGKNLCLRLKELNTFEIFQVKRETSLDETTEVLKNADVVFHLAGVNRPKNPNDFKLGNASFTEFICKTLTDQKKSIPIFFTSSTQVELDNLYGASKRAAEDSVWEYSRSTGAKAYVFRLPNVFGKWSKPNYNSVVATFCHNIARDLPITINDSSAEIKLVYLDDVIKTFIELIDDKFATSGVKGISPVYTTTVGELANQLQSFKESRNTLVIDRVGTGFLRALYSTYISFLPTEKFAYSVPKYGDARGDFVEMLKTRDSGQFSFFTAHPGVTRGGHYHHSKTEKFLVIKGKAIFRFRNIVTGEKFELVTDETKPEIVETIPGWAHDITNIGHAEMVVMLWANEIFDRANPDTISEKV